MRALVLLLALSACASPPNGVPTDPVAPGTRGAATMSLDSLQRADDDLQYSAIVRFPVLENAGPHTGAINAKLRADALETIGRDGFQPDTELAGTPVEDRGVSSTVELDVNAEAERLDARVFSVNRFVYAYTGGAHGMYWFEPATFDLASGAQLGLGDIVQTDAQGLAALSAAAERSLRRQGWDLDGDWGDGFGPDADNFGSFTLVPDSLVIHFPPYQVGPYSAGSFRAPIAFSELQPVLADGAPVR